LSKSDGYETSLLNLVFCSKAFTNVAVASTASTALWVSLHTADPTDSGSQATSEVTFGGYARIATSRTTSDGGWTVANGSVSPVTKIEFANQTGTSTTETITHFCVGLSSDGIGFPLYSGVVTPNLPTGEGILISLTTATAITED
jgi:hypothetical protein